MPKSKKTNEERPSTRKASTRGTKKTTSKKTTEEPKKKRRRKRGSLTKRNIIEHQRGNSRIIEKGPFKKLIRGLLNDLGYPKTGMRHGVVNMLMDYAENRYIFTLRLAKILATKSAGRKRQLKERDLELAADIEMQFRND